MLKKSVLFSLIYALVKWTGVRVHEEGNEYSIRHNEYNELFFNLYLQTHVLLLVGFCSMKNFNIRIGVKCLDHFLLSILMLVRTAMLIYQFGFVLPMFCKWIKMTYYLNQENWWKNPEEPFFTNSSIFNAYVCWVTWLIFRSYTFLFMYVIPTILIISLIQKIREKARDNG